MELVSAPGLVQKAWGKRIRNARLALELSQVAAAERIGCDQSTLSKIENGDYRQMHPDMVLKICVGLNLDPDQVFAWPPAIVEIARMRAGSAA